MSCVDQICDGYTNWFDLNVFLYWFSKPGALDIVISIYTILFQPEEQPK
jgi:hypothetical protein